jgi:Tol biopolymer transport system component/DNA-binding winged helix-turn-helix (wHTH) protein
MDKIAGYEFGPYLVEVETARLLCDGVPVGLQRKQFDLLLLLLGKAGEVVSRESILDAVWPDTIVEDSNLAQQIHHLRRLLKDTTNNSQYILTVPGRGYIFLQQVRPVFGAELVHYLARDRATVEAEEDELRTPAGPPSITESYRPYWRRHLRSIILVLLAMMGAGGLLALAFNIVGGRALRQLKVRKSIPVPGPRITPDISPDGRMIAFSSFGETGENEDIYLGTIDGDQVIRVTTHADADYLPVWSPDGQRLAFLRHPNGEGGNRRVMVVAPFERLEQDLGQAEDGLAWTPDGRHLVVTDHEDGLPGSALYQISIETRERRRLTNPDRPGVSDRMPRFASDGGRLAFLRWSGNSSADIHLLDLASREMTQLTSDRRPISGLQWGLRGGGFYYVSNRTGVNHLWHVFIHSQKVRQVHQFPIEISNFDITPEGTRLVYSRQIDDHQTEMVEIGSGNDEGRRPFSCLINSSGFDYAPVFSPHGQTVAFVSDRTGAPEIWTANADCTQLTRVTSLNELQVGNPAWSPDGTRIVFDRTVDGQSEIFTISADGRDLQRLTRNDHDDTLPTWSADGQWIYFTSPAQNGSQISRIPATGGEVETAVTGGASQPAVSPDGSILYFTRADILWRRDLRSGKEEVLRALLDIPVTSWRVTAGGVYFIARVAKTNRDPEADQFARLQVERLDLKTGKIDFVKWLQGRSFRDMGGLSISPDERRMAFAFRRSFRGELGVVEGWRLNPISQYLMDLFHSERLMIHTSHDWLSR